MRWPPAHRLGARVEPGRGLQLALAVLAGLSVTPGVRRRVRAPLAVLAALPGHLSHASATHCCRCLRANPGIVTRVIAAHAAPTERDRLSGSSEQTAVCNSFLAAISRAAPAGLIDDYLTYASEHGRFDLGCG